MDRIKSFLSMPVGDRVRLAVAAVQLVVLPVALSTLSFSRVRTVLVRGSIAASRVVPGQPTPYRLARTVEIADRHLPGERTCLVRSLATETLLRLYAHTPSHRIGVKKPEDGSVEAHSWIELDEEVLIGDLDDLSEYTPLPSLNGGDAS